MSVKKGDSEYTEFNDQYSNPEFLAPTEKAKIDFDVDLIGKVIETRAKKGLSQKKLADLAGLKQSAIARLESGKTTPQIDTLLKILQPLGYTLAVVPADNDAELWRRSDMAKLKFLLQGLSEDDDHYAAVKHVLNLENTKRCLVAVAFINSKGVELMLEGLSKSKDKLTIFVGIRNGVTSVQALELLLKNGITPICIDTATQAFIFHPKVYIAENLQTSRVLVGSANFTPGGLIKNVEGSMVAELDLTHSQDKILSDSVFDSFSKLQNENQENIFPLIDLSMLDELMEQGLLIDETDAGIQASARAKFKGSRKDQRKKMTLKKRKISIPRHSKHYITPTAPFENIMSVSAAQQLNQNLLWKSKPLSRRDLSIPKDTEKTHLTGSMYFNRGDKNQKFDFQHYFRDVAFADADWNPDSSPSKQHLERTFVKFRIIIKGIDHGIHDLKLSHNTRTDTETAKQKNGLTQIHWGKIKPLVSSEDLLEDRMYLYAPEEGSDTFTIVFDTDEEPDA